MTNKFTIRGKQHLCLTSTPGIQGENHTVSGVHKKAKKNTPVLSISCDKHRWNLKSILQADKWNSQQYLGKFRVWRYRQLGMKRITWCWSSEDISGIVLPESFQMRVNSMSRFLSFSLLGFTLSMQKHWALLKVYCFTKIEIKWDWVSNVQVYFRSDTVIWF